MSRDPNHPRPHLQRQTWELLDGGWDFAADVSAAHTHPATVKFDETITVPFAPETAASGIAFDGFLRRCWYRRFVAIAPPDGAERVWIRFGAVDRTATIWINGHRAGEHTGGYTPFSVDITDLLGPADEAGECVVEVIVQADDEPRNVAIPRGKQDWWPVPHVIWYPRTTGIWQSVWLERVPPVRVDSLAWEGDPRTLTVRLDARITGNVQVGDRVRVTLRYGDRVLVDDQSTLAEVVDGVATIRRDYGVGVQGVDDAYLLIWRPHHPALIEATVEVDGAHGHDEVVSYTAIRSVGVEHGRFVLNGQPYQLRLALDQGYWPDSGMTAPSLDALRRDVELVRELGLNGVRKHQKVEDPRWLALCDELGVLVWEELPSPYAFSARTVAAMAREWTEVIERDRNHPCIVAWVPVNESWGVPLATTDPQQAAVIAALGALTKALDGTRPVSGNDGWETLGGDIVGIHDYDQDAERVRQRYATTQAVDGLFAGFGPGGRALTTDGSTANGRAVIVSEFGGVTLADSAEGLFGYGNITNADDFVTRYRDLCGAILTSEVLSGYCWTQLTDTYQEANGLLRMDRTPKAPLAALHAASHGRTLEPS